MFATLSPDVVLYTLSYLTLPDVLKLYTLSRSVHSFLLDHEPSIFHRLAILHRFVSSGTTLDDAVVEEHSLGGLLDGVSTWKELCTSIKFAFAAYSSLTRYVQGRRWESLYRSWSGHAAVREGGYISFPQDTVRMFRVDEQERTILVLTGTGGSYGYTLSVCALEDGRLLWSLPSVRSSDAVSNSEY